MEQITAAWMALVECLRIPGLLPGIYCPGMSPRLAGRQTVWHRGEAMQMTPDEMRRAGLRRGVACRTSRPPSTWFDHSL